MAKRTLVLNFEWIYNFCDKEGKRGCSKISAILEIREGPVGSEWIENEFMTCGICYIWGMRLDAEIERPGKRWRGNGDHFTL